MWGWILGLSVASAGYDLTLERSVEQCDEGQPITLEAVVTCNDDTALPCDLEGLTYDWLGDSRFTDEQFAAVNGSTSASVDIPCQCHDPETDAEGYQYNLVVIGTDPEGNQVSAIDEMWVNCDTESDDTPPEKGGCSAIPMAPGFLALTGFGWVWGRRRRTAS